jgi:hypothetical protein
MIWYAHNGGEYDYKYLLDEIRKIKPHAKIRLICQGMSKRLIGAKVTIGKHRYEVRDSLSLVPVPLKKFLADFAPAALQKGELNFNEHVFDPTSPDDRAYLRADILGLLAALVTLRATVRDVFGVPLGWTAGATAMKAWRRTLAPGCIYWRGTEQREEFCREAYHGGLVTLSSIAPQTHVYDVDVNAMYAWCMGKGVPNGRYAWSDTEAAGYPGIYRCQVEVPEAQEFTFLPYRHPQFQCLCWPTGVFDTVLTTPEIDAARTRGIDVRISTGVVWEGVDTPFDLFINLAERLELSATSRDSATKHVAKILRNSLYGKFGAHGESMALCFEPDSVDGWEPIIDEITGEWRGLWGKMEELNAPYIHPEWASFITARARIMLSELVDAVGSQNCFYTDTDSLKVRADCPALSSLSFGRRYGQVKLVDRYQMFQAGGPKNYVGLTLEGEWKQACKGIPLKHLPPAVHLRALAGEHVTVDFLSMNASRRTLGGGVGYAQWRQRSVSHVAHARGWRHLGMGIVRPLHMERGVSV